MLKLPLDFHCDRKNYHECIHQVHFNNVGKGALKIQFRYVVGAIIVKQKNNYWTTH